MAVEDLELPEQFDESVKAKCQEITERCQEVYDIVKDKMQIMRRSEQVLHQFEDKKEGVTYSDVKVAKEQYTEARTEYLAKAGIISEGMPIIYKVSIRYKESHFLARNYNIYLAKLLATREARNPVEDFILHIANDSFSYEEIEMELSADDERKGVTIDKKQRVYVEQLRLTKDRLESRYLKRQLAARLKKGESKEKAITELKQILKRDPDDIRTYLLLSNLIFEQHLKVRDHAERIALRQDVVDCLETAFSKIDIYLDLQGVQEIQTRDLKRVGFIKTIAALRKMLKGA